MVRKTKFVIGMAVFVTALSLLTGCSQKHGKDIGNEKAKTTALSDAGVAEDEVTGLYVNRNEDDGRIIYEVDFTVSSAGMEYDLSLIHIFKIYRRSERVRGWPVQNPVCFIMQSVSYRK